MQFSTNFRPSEKNGPHAVLQENRRKFMKNYRKMHKNHKKNENFTKNQEKLQKNMKKTKFLLKISKNHEIFVKFIKISKNR
jgi:hypothetical protein